MRQRLRNRCARAISMLAVAGASLVLCARTSSAQLTLMGLGTLALMPGIPLWVVGAGRLESLPPAVQSLRIRSIGQGILIEGSF